MSTVHLIYSDEVFAALCKLRSVACVDQRSNVTAFDDMKISKFNQTQSAPAPTKPRHEIVIEGLADINAALDELPLHRQQVLAGRLKTEDDVQWRRDSQLMLKKPRSPRPINNGHTVSFRRVPSTCAHYSQPPMSVIQEDVTSLRQLTTSQSGRLRASAARSESCATSCYGRTAHTNGNRTRLVSLPNINVSRVGNQDVYTK